jgi:hypothetical protein
LERGHGIGPSINPRGNQEKKSEQSDSHAAKVPRGSGRVNLSPILSSGFDPTIKEGMGRNEQSFLMEIAGPKIEVPDLLKFETARNHSLSNKIMSRLKDLEREYNELRELHRWNEFVEGFQISFQTRLNQDYYLYESGSRKFLSLISPQEMGETYTYHGKTRLHSEGYFVRVDEPKG